MLTTYLTPEDVAGRLGVTRSTVYRWIKSGRVRACQAGSQWRIEETDLNRFLVPNSAPPTPPAPPRLSDEQAERAIAYLKQRLEEEPALEEAEGYPNAEFGVRNAD